MSFSVYFCQYVNHMNECYFLAAPTPYAGAMVNLHLRVQWANFEGFLILTGCISRAVQRLSGYQFAQDGLSRVESLDFG